MKATAYITNDYGEYMSRSLSFGTSLSGITTVTDCSSVSGVSFNGFGVAINGSSCYNLSLMDKESRAALLNDLYSTDGMGFGVGRITIGSSDYSEALYTYCDDYDVSLKTFSIDRDREYIIPIIKEILSVNPSLKLLASPWSPPDWMKTGGSVGGGYMRDKYVECYAEYFVKFLGAYKEEGIDVYAVTPQNEAETQQDGKMPACIWHPDTEANFIISLKKKLTENGLDTKIWCYDHNFSGVRRVEWCFGEYPSLVNCCDGVAFHYYSGSIEQTKSLREKYPSLTLNFTEGGPRLKDNYSTDWCKWGLMLIKALNCGYSSFTGWNLMLDETGGPNIGPFYCGGLVTRNSIDGSLSYSGQYKAFRHFTSINSAKTIKPLSFARQTMGMSTFPERDPIYCEGAVAFFDDGKRVLYIVNPSQNKEQLQYFVNGKHLYIEMLPNTLATIVIE